MKEITEKRKCIAEQAVYGDLQLLETVECTDYDYITIVRVNDYLQPEIVSGGDNYECGDEFDLYGSFKPILRPMSLLTKEITHNCYNHNKPFIPIVDFLEKNNKPRKFEIQGGVIKCTNARHAVNDYEIDNGYLYTFIKVENDFITPVISDFQNQFIDYMNMLHFDWRGLIENGESVSTEEVGDVYDVKQ